MLVLGFHGCERSVAERLVRGEAFHASSNDYDWLGGGVYFWQDSEAQAWHYIKHVKSGISEPAVIGAVIDLGFCADCLDHFWLQQLKVAHKDLAGIFERAGTVLPDNNFGKDKVRRPLDRLVFDNLHKLRETDKLPPVDTVRAIFDVGGEVFPGSGLKDKTHTQIVVRNQKCIKGVFWPRTKSN